jgi:pseudouridine synthase
LRLNKFISISGYAARRKSDELIKEGRVTVNSRVVTELGTKIDPDKDTVTVDGELIKPVTIDKNRFVYILLNKPAGYVTTTSDEKNRPTVMDLIGINKRIYPVGRLDFNSEGLLLLTNDGELANKLMHPKHEVKKTYLVKVNKPVSEKGLKRLSEGVSIEGRKTSHAVVRVVPKSAGRELNIIIHEGRKRQVRKMLEAVGCFVRKLKRIEYAGLNIKGMRPGEWRYLSEGEIKFLKKEISDG